LLSPDGEFGNKSFPEIDKKHESKADVKPSPSPKSESMGLEGIIVNMPQVDFYATNSHSEALYKSPKQILSIFRF